jgi:hypothetical protein
MLLSGKCNQSAGAPSLPVFFRQGWDTTNLNAHCCRSHPSQKNAKDGAPPLRGATGLPTHDLVAPPQLW